MVLVGIIVLGIGVFYQQQITNAAARGGSLRIRCTAQPRVARPFPTSPRIRSCFPSRTAIALRPPGGQVAPHDRPRSEHGLRHARGPACRSPRAGLDIGRRTRAALGGARPDPDRCRPPARHNEFRECTVPAFDGARARAEHSYRSMCINPRTGVGSPPNPTRAFGSTAPSRFPRTSATDDMASDYAASNASQANQVTALTCYAWRPPLAGFLLIPSTVNLTGRDHRGHGVPAVMASNPTRARTDPSDHGRRR